MASIKELTALMAKAVEDGNMGQVLAIATDIHKARGSIAKAEADRLKAEAEKMAGAREKLAAEVKAIVKKLGLEKQLAGVKAHGFSYTIDRYEKDETGSDLAVYGGCVLIVPATKARRGGTSGGGKTKEAYGMSLMEVFDKFATPEDRAELDSATSNSKSWQIKESVRKRAIADGLLKPVK